MLAVSAHRSTSSVPPEHPKFGNTTLVDAHRRQSFGRAAAVQ